MFDIFMWEVYLHYIHLYHMIAITNTDISKAERQDPLQCNKNILSCSSVRCCRRLRIQERRRRRRTQSLSSLYYMWLVIILQTNINQFDEIRCIHNICIIDIDLEINVVVAAIEEETYNNNKYNVVLWNETITRNIVDHQQQHWFEQHQLRVRNIWQQTIQQWLHRRRRQRSVKNDELHLTNQNKYNSTTIQSLHIPIISDPTLTYHLHPTTILSIPSERRKLHLSSYRYGSHTYSNDTNYNTISIDRSYNKTYTTTTNRNSNIKNNDNNIYQQWFAKEETSSIYATIPDQDDPNHIHNRILHEFYKNRHLSRYEQFYRTTNHYNLQYNWNGYYDEIFQDTIVQFDINTTTFSRMNNDNDMEGLDNDDWLSSFKKDIVSNLYPRRQRQYLLNNNNTKKRRLDHRMETSYSNDNTIINGGFYNNYQAVPLSQGYGTHFANVWVGTPTPQRKTVIVDTGSHYTAFPCTGCKNCGAPHHTDPYYRPENSNTFQQLQCNECQDGVLCENSKWYRNESDCFVLFCFCCILVTVA